MGVILGTTFECGFHCAHQPSLVLGSAGQGRLRLQRRLRLVDHPKRGGDRIGLVIWLRCLLEAAQIDDCGLGVQLICHTLRRSYGLGFRLHHHGLGLRLRHHGFGLRLRHHGLGFRFHRQRLGFRLRHHGLWFR